MASTPMVAQEPVKNGPDLSLPISDKKKVIAHCMTNIIRFKGHKLEDSCDPEYYEAKGNSTASLGGLTQVKPLSDSLLRERTLDEAVEFEMRTALKSGIDGFQFYYVLGLPEWDEIIKAYFRVAGQQQLDFKLTLCISHPGGSTETVKIEELARRMNGIFETVGRNNPHWLRTPDGRLLLYMWYGEQLADIPVDKKGLPDAYYVARAYQKLAAATGERFACAYSINERIAADKLDQYLDYFPTVWMWTVSYTNNYAGQFVADRCRQRGRTFMGSAFPDFYTSKLLKRGTWDMFHHAKDAVEAGIDKVERKYIATGLSWNYRKMLEFAIAQEAPIINIITWNDYPEGHHLAPEWNHNDGFSLLLKHYKSVWKKEPSPFRQQDVAIAFFKKYPHSVKPKPYNIPVESFQEDAVEKKAEDSIEVVTMLQDKAQLIINGKAHAVPAGLAVTRVRQQEGAVQVFINRNGRMVKKLLSPERITLTPLRTDRLTYSWSTESETYRQSLANELPIATTTLGTQ